MTDCTGLTTINLPNSLISIEEGAFQNCTNLTRIAIPESITRIIRYTFKDCTNLTNLTIPGNVTSFRLNSIEGCNSLTSFRVPAGCSIPDFQTAKILNENTFENFVWENNYVLSNGHITNYGGEYSLDYPVMSSVPVTRYSFSGSVGVIPEVFYRGVEFENISTLSLDQGVDSILKGAFYSTNLKEIAISGCPVISSYVFANTSSIEDIHLNSPIPLAIDWPEVRNTTVSFRTEDVFEAPTASINTISTPLANDGQALLVTLPIYDSWKASAKLKYDMPGTYEVIMTIIPNSVVSSETRPGTFTASMKYYNNEGNYTEYCELNSSKRPVEYKGDSKQAESICLGTIELGENCDNTVVVTLESATHANFSRTIILDDITLKFIKSSYSMDEINSKRQNGIFSEATFNNATLHVPSGSIDAYRNAPCWKLFKNIVEDGQTSVNNVPGIQSESQYYDIMGRPALAPMGRGLYIKDGKKVYVAE